MSYRYSTEFFVYGSFKYVYHDEWKASSIGTTHVSRCLFSYTLKNDLDLAPSWIQLFTTWTVGKFYLYIFFFIRSFMAFRSKYMVWIIQFDSTPCRHALW